MIRTINDFLTLWEQEANATRKLFAAMTDDSLGKAIDSEHRTVGRLAWHLAQTIPEMLGKVGLAPTGPGEHDPVPTSAKAIADAYDSAAASVAEAVLAAGWTDAILDESREMYGETWTVAASLLSCILHQVHHRAQMTVLMRQAGLRVPGLYGPAKEDWATWGIPAPEI